jgi:cytochrome c556
VKRLICMAGVLALVGATALTTSRAQDDKTPTIKEVMGKLHKGAKSPLAQLKTQLKAANPPWKQVQDETKDFVILGASLAKNNPPRGDQASWKTLADGYFRQAKAMDDAAQKEDKPVTQAAYNKLASSCMSCHRAHRGR